MHVRARGYVRVTTRDESDLTFPEVVWVHQRYALFEPRFCENDRGVLPRRWMVAEHAQLRTRMHRHDTGSLAHTVTVPRDRPGLPLPPPLPPHQRFLSSDERLGFPR
jgi:hypothetical protein